MSDEATETLDDELVDDDELATEAEAPDGLDQEALERRSAALSQVVKFGDPVLKSAASPVAEFDDRLAKEAQRMIGLMHDAIGVGLAATQLGVLRRMLVFQVGIDAEPTVLVNPEIEWRSEDAATAEEGCLSIPGRSGRRRAPPLRQGPGRRRARRATHPRGLRPRGPCDPA